MLPLPASCNRSSLSCATLFVTRACHASSRYAHWKTERTPSRSVVICGSCWAMCGGASGTLPRTPTKTASCRPETSSAPTHVPESVPRCAGPAVPYPATRATSSAEPSECRSVKRTKRASAATSMNRSASSFAGSATSTVPIFRNDRGSVETATSTWADLAPRSVTPMR